MPVNDTLLRTYYRIERRVGQGAMSAVYQALDLRDGDRVAIKHVPAGDERSSSALDREARLLARLRHPIMPRVREYFADQNGWYLVMDFVPGDDLAALVQREGARPPADVLRWADQLLDGLEYLHTRRPPVIHRDIKPRNLKLTAAGDIVLLDFGLSKGASGTPADDASVFGYTLAYAPLEQIRGQGTSPRSDLYALAATLYDLLTGAPPPSAVQRAAALLEQLPDPLRQAHTLNPHVAPSLSAVLHSALAINPAQRPASAVALRMALHSAGDPQATVVETSPAVVVSARRNRLHNLPAQPTPLVGRGEQLAALGALLRRPDVRLISLTGPAGIGKTRLALQAAEHRLPEYADGVFFVPLAAISDSSLVAPTIAAALGIKERAGQPLAETLQSYLREKELLLLLDNFEQILDAALLVADLLAAAPRLTIVVTTREILRLRGEYDLPVPPLALPPQEPENQEPRTENQPESIVRRPWLVAEYDQLRTMDDGQLTVELTHYGAIELFVRCAQAARLEFTLTAANAHAVVAICRRLDGLPLAIELAAARIRALTPAELLSRLERRLDLLTEGPRDLPTRQQTLRGAISWSYDLLNAAERSLFAQLGMFVGGWSVEAAEAVTDFGLTILDFRMRADPGAIENPKSKIVHVLDGLADKSLLHREEGLSGTQRFDMLESIREYALEQLAASGQHEYMRQRHAEYFLALAEQAAPELRGSEQARWLDVLEAEHDNMRAGHSWVVERGQAELALRLGAALGPFWELRGYLNEGRARLTAALALGGAPSHLLHAQALNRLGNLCYVQSDLQDARSAYAQSLAISREMGNQAGTAWALFHLGRAQREYAPAQAYLSEGLALFRALDDRAGIAAALNELGGFERWRGAYATAHAYHQESLALYRELGDQVGYGSSLYQLASIAQSQGDLDSARLYYGESMELFEQLGARGDWAWALQNVGATAAHQGDFAAAEAAFAESTAAFYALGDQSGIAWSCYNRGFAALNRGDAAAYALLSEGLALFRAVDDTWGVSWSLTMLGAAAITRGVLDRARDWLQEGLTLHQQVVSTRGIIYSIEGFAQLAAACEQAERAARLFGAAEVLRAQIAATLYPAERPAYDRRIAAIRTRLGEMAFAAAWAAGRAMSLDQAIATTQEQQ
jgi:predicted ATPase